MAMKAHVENPDGTYEEREMGNPVCGEDFCDHCGDCLACYYEDGYCFDGHGHLWVIYIEDSRNPHSEGGD